MFSGGPKLFEKLFSLFREAIMLEKTALRKQRENTPGKVCPI